MLKTDSMRVFKVFNVRKPVHSQYEMPTFVTSLNVEAIRPPNRPDRAPGLLGTRASLRTEQGATRNKCLTSSNKKLLGTSATLVVTSALLVVTRSY